MNEQFVAADYHEPIGHKGKLMISAKNKPFNGNDNTYRGLLANQPWSLCVGAGISFGMIPTWQDLTREVLNEVFETKYDEDEFKQLTDSTRWSLDSLLQGAANYLNLKGRPEGEFANVLEKEGSIEM